MFWMSAFAGMTLLRLFKVLSKLMDTQKIVAGQYRKNLTGKNTAALPPVVDKAAPCFR